jgi:hypothetical protein
MKAVDEPLGEWAEYPSEWQQAPVPEGPAFAVCNEATDRKTPVIAMSRHVLHSVVGATAAVLLAVATPCAGDEIPYVVLRGENPWTISVRHLRSMALWPRLVSHNRIADPRRIAPGTVLRIPESWLVRRNVPAVVLATDGEIWTTHARGEPSRLKAGDGLAEGVVLKAGALGSASLGLFDGSRILIKSGSELAVESHAEIARDRRSIRLDLRRGALENDVETRSSSSGGRFEIRTPAGIAAARGTRFRIAAREAETSIEVLAGAVTLGNSAGEIDVTAGFGASAGVDRAPDRPRALLPAPDLTTVSSRVERVAPDLPFTPLAGAVAYRTQIAADEGFAALLSDQTAPLPVARMRDLPDGEYHLRVRGIDADGFEGFSAQRRLVIDARPEPPFLLAPPDGALVLEARPSFRWTGRQGALSYRFQLGRDAAFTDLLLDRQDIAGDGIRADDDLLPGEYFWRVAAFEATEGPGPFSAAQSLRRLPDAPAIDLQDQDGKRAIHWRPGGPGERLQLQIAADDAFAPPLVDLTVEQPEVELPELASGTYRLRARTIAGDGFTGAWGTVQQFEIRPSLTPALLLLLIPVLLAL